MLGNNNERYEKSKMKKGLKYFAVVLVVMLCTTIISACGSARVSYDLTQMTEVAVQGVVQNMQDSSTVREYLGKNIKIKAKLEEDAGWEYITGVGNIASCCNWQIEVRFEDESIKPSYDKKKTFTGTYKSEKVGGYTSYYLNIIEVK